MDLRSLVNKLDTIEQRTLLQESEQLIDEAARLRYKDVEAVAKQFPTDEVARGKALADLAKANGLPGLFDPVSRELVKLDGTLANFAGADEATVNQLQQWGLLPLGAKTSSWLGFRGRDEKTAMGANQSAQSRDALTDKAMALMDKAVQAAAAPAANEGALSTSGIASALIEEFGFNGIELLEAITPAEHTELKKLVQDLYKAAPADPDVVQVTTTYNGYLKQRDQIIQRINELIKIIKSKPAPAPKTVAKENLETSKERMIAEGRIQVLEDGQRYLRDGLVWTYDPKTELYSHLSEDGTLTEYDKKQFYSDTGDFARGVGNGLTLGYGDNISAGVQALFTDKTYKDALKAELAKSKKAEADSPWLYGGGQVIGFIANPLSKIGLGLPGTIGKLTTGAPLLAATLASDKFVREPWNASVLNAPNKKDKKADGTVPPQPTVNGKPSTGPKGQAWLKKYGATHNPDGTPKTAGVVKKVNVPATPAAAEKVAAEPALPTVAAEKVAATNITGEPGQKSAIDALTPTAQAPTAQAPAAPERGSYLPPAAEKVAADAPVQIDVAKIKSMLADIRKLATDKNLNFYTAMDQYASTANLAEGIQLTIEQQHYLTEMNSIRRLSGLPLIENPFLPILGKFTKPAADAIKAGWSKITSGGAGSAEKAAAEAAEAAAKAARQQADDALAAAKKAADAARAKPALQQTAADKIALQAEKQAAQKVDDVVSQTRANTRNAADEAWAQRYMNPSTTAAAEKTLLAKFGEKAVAALSKLKSLGGSALKFMGNNKFMTLAAMIGAAGFIFGPNGVEEDPVDPNSPVTPVDPNSPVTPVDPNSPVTPVDPNAVVVPDKDGKCPTGYRLSADKKTCEKVSEGGQEVTPVSPDLSELQKLVDQLHGGWPTDPETAAALASAKAAGAKVPEGSGGTNQAGMDVTGSSNTPPRPVNNFSGGKDFYGAMTNATASKEAGK